MATYPAGFTHLWGEGYDDEIGPRLCVALNETSGNVDRLYRLDLDGVTWLDVTNQTDYAGGYSESGEWQSFQWGQAVVFNNGVDVPQILLPNATQFKNLANWGFIGGIQKVVTAKVIRPFRNVMISMGITTDGTLDENEINWSDPQLVADGQDFVYEPSWDYSDPTVIAGRNYIGIDQGPLVDLLPLGNRVMFYTGQSAHIMTPVGGRALFKVDDAQFEYGLVSMGAVSAYENMHFCVSPKTMYIHDGVRVKLIGEARIDRTFYDSGVKTSLKNVFCEEDIRLQEIHVVFDAAEGDRGYIIYNYRDDNWSFGQCFITDGANREQTVHMEYGQLAGEGAGAVTWDGLDPQTWADLTGQTWASFGGQAGESPGRVMYWFTDTGLWASDANFARDENKEYFIEHTNIDFSELDPSLTTEKIKHIETIIPHIDSSVRGEIPAVTQFTLRSGQSLKSAPSESEEIQIFDVNAEQYKMDFRISGRWLAMRIDVIGPGQWRLSTMDYDMEALYGR